MTNINETTPLADLVTHDLDETDDYIVAGTALDNAEQAADALFIEWITAGGINGGDSCREYMAEHTNKEAARECLTDFQMPRGVDADDLLEAIARYRAELNVPAPNRKLTVHRQLCDLIEWLREHDYDVDRGTFIDTSNRILVAAFRELGADSPRSLRGTGFVALDVVARLVQFNGLPEFALYSLTEATAHGRGRLTGAQSVVDAYFDE